MRSLSIIALVTLVTARSAAAVDVTECGQVIQKGEVGELRNDLQCVRRPTWPFSAQGVYLYQGATLRLNGFAIAGDDSGVGIECGTTGVGRNRCTIEGPGEVRGFYAGVNCGGCRVVARAVIFRANTNGIYIPLSGRLVAENVVAIDNVEEGIWAQSVRAKDVEASRNGGSGVNSFDRLRVRGLTALANGGPGVRGGSKGSRIVESTVTDNDTTGDGYDITSTGPVRLVRTSCGQSAKLRYVSQEEFKIVGSFGCTDD